MTRFKDAIDFTWALIKGKPTTLAGFGIADAAASVHTHAEADVTSLVADLAAKQPLDSDLTAIAALSTTAYGRALLALADAAALRTAGGLGTAALADTGTLAANVPTITQADARYWALATDLATQAELNAHEADTTAIHGIPDTSALLTGSVAASTYQPLDSDLTAIAALTTTAYGRSLLAAADASALRTLAALGSLATLSSITASLISDASANGRSLITATDYAAMKTLLALTIGTNVQAWNTQLDAIAALTTTAYGRSYLALADAAAARALDASAPAAAKYIVQTSDSELSAEQALAALASGYLKNTTGTGVLSVQATPIPIADGGTNASTAAAALASLGAALAIPRGRLVVGGTTHYSLPGVDAQTPSTFSATAGVVRYAPILIETPITIDQLALEVTTAGAGATTLRMAIYSADAAWQPVALIVDAGTVAADSTGVKAASVNTALPAGRYLTAFNGDGAPTLRCVRGGHHLIGYQSGLGASLYFATLSATQTYGAFPGTPTAIANTPGNAVPIAQCVFLRVSVP